MTTAGDLHRVVEVELAALDTLATAIRSFRDALAAVLASFDASPAKLEAKELLSVSEVSRKYKVSRRTVLEARRKGHLRGMKPGGSSLILFDVAAVEEWMQGRSARLRVAR